MYIHFLAPPVCVCVCVYIYIYIIVNMFCAFVALDNKLYILLIVINRISCSRSKVSASLIPKRALDRIQSSQHTSLNAKVIPLYLSISVFKVDVLWF